LGDAPLLGLVAPPVARLPLEGRLGLGEYLVEPAVDLAGLDIQLLGQLRHRLLAGHVPADHLVIL